MGPADQPGRVFRPAWSGGPPALAKNGAATQAMPPGLVAMDAAKRPITGDEPAADRRDTSQGQAPFVFASAGAPGAPSHAPGPALRTPLTKASRRAARAAASGNPATPAAAFPGFTTPAPSFSTPRGDSPMDCSPMDTSPGPYHTLEGMPPQGQQGSDDRPSQDAPTPAFLRPRPFWEAASQAAAGGQSAPNGAAGLDKAFEEGLHLDPESVPVFNRPSQAAHQGPAPRPRNPESKEDVVRVAAELSHKLRLPVHSAAPTESMPKSFEESLRCLSMEPLPSQSQGAPSNGAERSHVPREPADAAAAAFLSSSTPSVKPRPSGTSQGPSSPDQGPPPKTPPCPFVFSSKRPIPAPEPTPRDGIPAHKRAPSPAAPAGLSSTSPNGITSAAAPEANEPAHPPEGGVFMMGPGLSGSNRAPMRHASASRPPAWQAPFVSHPAAPSRATEPSASHQGSQRLTSSAAPTGPEPSVPGSAASGGVPEASASLPGSSQHASGKAALSNPAPFVFGRPLQAAPAAAPDGMPISSMAETPAPADGGSAASVGVDPASAPKPGTDGQAYQDRGTTHADEPQGLNHPERWAGFSAGVKIPPSVRRRAGAQGPTPRRAKAMPCKPSPARPQPEGGASVSEPVRQGTAGPLFPGPKTSFAERGEPFTFSQVPNMPSNPFAAPMNPGTSGKRGPRSSHKKFTSPAAHAKPDLHQRSKLLQKRRSPSRARSAPNRAGPTGVPIWQPFPSADGSQDAAVDDQGSVHLSGLRLEERNDYFLRTTQGLKKVDAEKDCGNAAFAGGFHDQAERCYQTALLLLRQVGGEAAREAKLHGNLSATKLARGHPFEALDHCQAALKADPSFARGLVRAADVHSRMGDFAAAIARLETIRNLPQGADKLQQVTQLQQRCTQAQAAAEAAASQANGEAALKLLEAVLQPGECPWCPRLAACSAHLLLQSSRYGDAARLADCFAQPSATCRDVQHWPLWVHSQAAFFAGDLQKACTMLQKGQWSLKPEEATAGSHCLPSPTEVQAAVTSLQRLMQLKQAGNDAVKACKFPEAVAQYTAALVACAEVGSPVYAAVLHSNRAAALQSQHLHAEAMADCLRARALDPGFTKAHTRLATLLAEVSLFEQAAASMEDAQGTLGSGVSYRERSEAARRQREYRMLTQRRRPPDHAKLLGLSSKALPDEIKRTYKKLALKFHPDKALSHCRFAAQLSPSAARILTASQVESRVREAADWLFKHINEAQSKLIEAAEQKEVAARAAAARSASFSRRGFHSYGQYVPPSWGREDHDSDNSEDESTAAFY
ncbi:hypothetical protein WJX84_009838 [Apatococcus fuscideae]|uniref:J domain-containing protein n=1 Tax=Apatococcus fuscideae TaxID=2026836 RepID=A0AAW1T7F1_9CHLO